MSDTRKYSRFSLFPIKFPKLFALYEKQRDCIWVPAEVDLETDVKEFRDSNIITPNDVHFLIFTLAFFSQADGIVLQNLNVNFSLDLPLPEASIFYGIQAGIEAIHWEMYGRLIETLIDDPEARAKAENAIENYPCIRQKADWILKWMSSGRPFLQRLVAFACTEGIFFSSAFASIFYYKKRGVLPGLSLSNKFIARDEGLHRDFGIELVHTLLEVLRDDPEYFKFLLGLDTISDDDCLSEATALEIVTDSVEIESNFVRESLNVELIGINVDSMIQYVQFVADKLLSDLGYSKHYNVDNPFDWMDMISLTGKQNFFEGRVSEYKKKQSGGGGSFGIDDDF